MSLSGKVAVVTGASRGIGRAIAENLADAGVKVIGTATSANGSEAISEYLGDRGQGYVLNVRDAEQAAGFMKLIAGEHGSVDILVNNAGITQDNLLMRMKDDEWDSVIETNLSGVFRLSKGALRGMTKARWGRIVNISSVVGSTGNPGQANYAATKAGLEGFTKSLAREVATRGVTVNSVAPGFIATQMTEVLTDDQKESIIKNIPMQRLGTPEDIAKAVMFLVGESGSYITGETLHVNGGMLMA